MGSLASPPHQRMSSPLLISHHHPRDHHRCVRLTGLMVCARCLGVYPVMALLLGVQVALRAPIESRWNLAWLFLLVVPGLADWARGRLDPAAGGNATRLVTGALLGAGLARSLYLHFRQPGHPLAVIQFVGIAVVFGLVEAFAWRRRRVSDPGRGSAVEEREPGGTER